ncbi:hypothetical protein FBEOM_7165 [Fusarium beomiforme]|uniref:Ubiquitin-like protease family profile domain-containing protein n=1 Tax=Fusarium beomiforme TaxID=44412 RepID=A0A9P5AIA6_9HYPO|nr:hypothetical protein FBEOM_7165 [Fusarium beomiforme]
MPKPTKVPKAEQEEWLDQQWGGKSWLPENVRNANKNPPKTNEIASQTINYLTKITRVAFRKLKQALHPQTAQESERHEACVHVASDDSKSESESSDDEDGSDIPNKAGYIKDKSISPKRQTATKPPVAAIKMSSNKDKHEFERSLFLPAPPEPRALTYPVSAPVPRILSPPPANVTSDVPVQVAPLGRPLTCHVTPLKRKSDKGSSPTTPQRFTKRAETVKADEKAWEAASIYEQLVDNVKLKDSTLDFPMKVVVACHPLEHGRVKVLNPLWFKLDGSKNQSTKLDNYTKLCFSVHHMKPKHWTLAVVDIDDEADTMALSHHDSMSCEKRFKAVCSRFMQWKESVGFPHKLRFNNVTPCTQQYDHINCGIHALSCLRHDLKNKPCPLFLDPAQERKYFIKMIKQSKEGDQTLQDVKKVIKYQEEKQLFKEIQRATLESLEENSRLAAATLNDARASLKHTQAELARLQMEQKVLFEHRERLHDTLEAECNNLSGRSDCGLLSDTESRSQSQQELSTHASQRFHLWLNRSFSNGSQIGQKVLEKYIDEITEKVEQAEVDVERKKAEVGEAERTVELQAHKHAMKEALISLQSLSN